MRIIYIRMPTFSNTQDSVKLFLQSSQASVALSPSHLFFYLNDIIQTIPNHAIAVSLLDAEIPFSFYQVNSKNNVLSGTIGDSTFSFTISAGNYNVEELIAVLNQEFTSASLTCVLTYSAITNAITFTSTGNALALNSTSTALGLVGFSADKTLSGTSTLVSTQGVNLFPIRNLYIKLQNLNIRNSYNKGTSKIIAKIPIDVKPNGYVFYTAHSNISSYILDPLIDTIELIICDEEENEVDFNSIEFSLSLGLVFDKFIPRNNKMRLIDDELKALNGR